MAHVPNAKMRGWMGEHRVSIRKFADDVGIPFSTFYSKLTGNSEWNVPEVTKILDYTGETYESLFE